jgi:hypothetical protein
VPMTKLSMDTRKGGLTGTSLYEPICRRQPERGNLR